MEKILLVIAALSRIFYYFIIGALMELILFVVIFKYRSIIAWAASKVSNYFLGDQSN